MGAERVQEITVTTPNEPGTMGKVFEVIAGAGHFIHAERPTRLADSVARHFG